MKRIINEFQYLFSSTFNAINAKFVLVFHRRVVGYVVRFMTVHNADHP